MSSAWEKARIDSREWGSVGNGGGEPHSLCVLTVELLSPFDKAQGKQEWLSYLGPDQAGRAAQSEAEARRGRIRLGTSAPAELSLRAKLLAKVTRGTGLLSSRVYPYTINVRTSCGHQNPQS